MNCSRFACSRYYSAEASSAQNDYVTLTTVEKGIVHVELNRPDKMNSLNMNMFQAIAGMIVDWFYCG